MLCIHGNYNCIVDTCFKMIEMLYVIGVGYKLKERVLFC